MVASGGNLAEVWYELGSMDASKQTVVPEAAPTHAVWPGNPNEDIEMEGLVEAKPKGHIPHYENDIYAGWCCCLISCSVTIVKYVGFIYQSIASISCEAHRDYVF